MLNGWLILDKPTGMSSAHAVAKVKRLLKPKKIGHAGTLDPLASGVLPLALGEATKTINYMMESEKSYLFTVTWGESRDTDDCEGKPQKISQNRPTKADIMRILPSQIGERLQVPPQFSALKVGGQRAYDLARAGEVVDLKARKIKIDSLDLVEDQTPQQVRGSSTFICHCGKGTYIRSIARDMGEILGCYGHVSMLRRLSVGKFSEKDAISLENLEKMVHNGDLGLLPVDSALDDILALEITTDQAMLLKRGQFIQVSDVSNETVLARCDGKPVAICSVSQGLLKPVRVFNL